MGGRDYADRYRQNTDKPSDEYKQALAGPHEPGETLTVYYDPSDPMRCTLVRAARAGLIAVLIVMIPLFAHGLYALKLGILRESAFFTLASLEDYRWRSKPQWRGPMIAAAMTGAILQAVIDYYLPWRVGWWTGCLLLIACPLTAWIMGRARQVTFLAGRLDVGEPRAAPVIEAVLAAAPRTGVVVEDAPPGTSCSAVAAVRGALPLAARPRG